MSKTASNYFRAMTRRRGGITAAVSTKHKKSSILGTFEGECADANITNLNGMDITRQVWETLFASDEYKRAIELGHYIGFFGHPEETDDQNKKNACIVMTECHIDDDGKVRGKFNLIDTPVGRIVKAFIDAGVKFGISVRGQGDLIDNSVDPDTFIFRGFDIVTFPAYPDSIPNFTEIAASTDVEKQAAYKKICAAVNNNIEGLSSVASIKSVQKCFAAQSSEYKALEQRKQQLTASSDVDVISQKLDGVTSLYLEQLEANQKLQEENRALRVHIQQVTSSYDKKFDTMRRICGSQMDDLNKQLERVEAACSTAQAANSHLKAESERIVASNTSVTNELNKVRASTQISQNEVIQLKKDLKAAQDTNLKYQQRVDSATAEISRKDKVIAGLRSELSETVTKVKASERQASNRDAEVAGLKRRIEAAEKLVADYQDAYANLYASAIGANLPSLSVRASTSVDELKSSIRAAASLPGRPDMMLPTHLDGQQLAPEDFESSYEDDDDSSLVTR